MANNIAFQPMGPTVSVTASTANTQGNVVAITAVSPVNQYFVSNPDITYGVFIAYGDTDQITAAIPNGTPENVVYIPAYSYKVFTGPQVSATKTIYVRTIATHNNSVVYICPGEGM